MNDSYDIEKMAEQDNKRDLHKRDSYCMFTAQATISLLPVHIHSMYNKNNTTDDESNFKCGSHAEI